MPETGNMLIAAPEFILSDNVIGEGRKGETAGDR